MPNNYVGSESDKYFLKIAPDFSVFNIAEKYMVENEKDGEDKLFFFNRHTKDVKTSFRRGMFKIDNFNAEVDVKTEISYKIFEVGDSLIVIFISTMDEPIEFSLNLESRVIGVTF